LSIKTPPHALTGLVRDGTLNPCRTIDLICGPGNYALYLASQGSDATGVESSSVTTTFVRKKAIIKGVKCRFIAEDFLDDLHDLEGAGTFDFAFD
jgi:tRNA/tmRNA/rRNA uracil-C5-methylase (TrmA/RlmC/RlmD family)